LCVLMASAMSIQAKPFCSGQASCTLRASKRVTVPDNFPRPVARLASAHKNDGAASTVEQQLPSPAPLSRRQLGGFAALVASSLLASEQSALARTMAEMSSGDVGGTDNYNPNIMAGPDFNALGEVKREAWDGKMASGCLLTEDGKDCRMQQLGDVDSQEYPGGGGRQIVGSKRTSQNAEYVSETEKLIKDTREVLNLDPFDPLRVNLAPALKLEGQQWVAKYARAGKTDAPSAQKVYTAMDALLGHFASRGVLAPMYRSVQNSVLDNVSAAESLLASGK